MSFPSTGPTLLYLATKCYLTATVASNQLSAKEVMLNGSICA